MNSGQGTMGSALGAGHCGLSKEAPAGYKRTEVGVIPNAWDAVQLGDLFEFKNGLNKAKQFFGSGKPIVNYMDVFERPGIRMHNLSGRVNLSPDEIKKFQVRLGDVFFTRTSETVEEIGVASVMLENPCDTVFSGFVLRARPRNDRLDDRYKQYSFGSKAVRSQIISNATYTTRALTNGRSLSAVWVAVPPKSEQRAIAEALSDVDGLLAALEALIAKKQAIKQAAMQQLLDGTTRLPGFSEAWETRRISEISDVDVENLPSDTNPDFTFNYISLEQVDAGRLLGYVEVSFRIAPSRARRVLRYGDVLMSTVRPSLMAHLLYREQIPNAVCSTGFAVLRTKSHRFDPGFLFAHMLGHVVNKQVDRILAGSNYPAINRRDVQLLEISCPPQIQEQRAIAAILSDMDTEIAALQQRRDKTREIKQGMMQQLLTGQVRLVNGQEVHDYGS